MTTTFDRDRLFDEIDQRFGRNVARFVDARLSEGAALEACDIREPRVDDTPSCSCPKRTRRRGSAAA